MSDGIDASVHWMQSLRLDPPVDRILAQANCQQLVAADDAFLTRGERRDRGIDSARFTLPADSAGGVNLVTHVASVAPSAGRLPSRGERADRANAPRPRHDRLAAIVERASASP